VPGDRREAVARLGGGCQKGVTFRRARREGGEGGVKDTKIKCAQEADIMDREKNSLLRQGGDKANVEKQYLVKSGFRWCAQRGKREKEPEKGNIQGT